MGNSLTYEVLTTINTLEKELGTLNNQMISNPHSDHSTAVTNYRTWKQVELRIRLDIWRATNIILQVNST